MQKVIEANFNDRYYKSKSVYITTEAYTTNAKRADILFAFKRSHYRIYTAVVEAKSRRTLKDLKPKNNSQKQTIIGGLLAIIMIPLILAALGINAGLNVYSSFLLLVLFVIIALSIGFIFRHNQLPFVQSIPAIEQLKRYPANEKWLAIAADTFVNKSDYDTLIKYCKKAAIGLLSVDRNEKIKIILKTKSKHESNQYLNYYKAQAAIKKALNHKSSYKTPAEKSKIIFHLKLFFSIIISITLAVLIIKDQQTPKKTAIYSTPKQQEQTTDLLTPHPIPENYEQPPFLASNREQDCNAFDISKRTIILVEMICDAKTIAIQRIATLHDKGFNNMYFVHSSCINSWLKKDAYVIYHNSFYNKWKNANTAAKALQKSLESKGINCNYCKPMILKPFQPIQAPIH